MTAVQVKGALPLGAGHKGGSVHGRAQPCPRTLPRNSQTHHYHVLWALNSGSQSLRTRRSPLSPCHVNAPSWLRLVQLVAPTHTVISHRGGTDSESSGTKWMVTWQVWSVAATLGMFALYLWFHPMFVAVYAEVWIILLLLSLVLWEYMSNCDFGGVSCQDDITTQRKWM